MPVNLNRPLPKVLDADQRAMLRLLQGGVLNGHGRRTTAHVFLRFDPNQAAKARAFLRWLHPGLTSAAQQAEQARAIRAARRRRRGDPHTPLFMSCMLSSAGYAALGIPAAATPASAEFRAGLKARGPSLADPPPQKWEAPYRQEIHSMVLIGGNPDRPGASRSRQVDAALARLRRALPAGAVRVLAIERGRAYFNAERDGIEHFGYVDGRSQPLLREVDIEREAAEKDGIERWNPSFPLRQVLVRDPSVARSNAYGSYFVFRKLEQNVRAFTRAERALGARLHRLAPGFAPELAGATIVGRFRDGAPVVLQRRPGMHNPVPNDFDYAVDVHGLKCPFHAHIRKVNPRGDSVRTFGVPLAQERSHIIARRGITYGARRQNRAGEFTDAPTRGVGLLFMAFQADLGNQFEFTQRSWANSDDFARPATGIDPIIGQGSGSAHTHRAGWGDANARTVRSRFADFVTLKGGEYFFAPSLEFFARLK